MSFRPIAGLFKIKSSKLNLYSKLSFIKNKKSSSSSKGVTSTTIPSRFSQYNQCQFGYRGNLQNTTQEKSTFSFQNNTNKRSSLNKTNILVKMPYIRPTKNSLNRTTVNTYSFNNYSTKNNLSFLNSTRYNTINSSNTKDNPIKLNKRFPIKTININKIYSTRNQSKNPVKNTICLKKKPCNINVFNLQKSSFNGHTFVQNRKFEKKEKENEKKKIVNLSHQSHQIEKEESILDINPDKITEENTPRNGGEFEIMLDQLPINLDEEEEENNGGELTLDEVKDIIMHFDFHEEFFKRHQCLFYDNEREVFEKEKKEKYEKFFFN